MQPPCPTSNSPHPRGNQTLCPVRCSRLLQPKPAIHSKTFPQASRSKWDMPLLTPPSPPQCTSRSQPQLSRHQARSAIASMGPCLAALAVVWSARARLSPNQPTDSWVVLPARAPATPPRPKRSTSSFYSCSSNRSSDRPPMIRECSNTIISSIHSTRRRSRPRVLAAITIHRCADLCTLISTITICTWIQVTIMRSLVPSRLTRLCTIIDLLLVSWVLRERTL